MVGASFVPVNGNAKYRLGDLAVEGILPDGDYLQLINGSDLATVDKMYAYVTKEVAMDPDIGGGDLSLVGWYDLNKGGVG